MGTELSRAETLGPETWKQTVTPLASVASKNLFHLEEHTEDTYTVL